MLLCSDADAIAATIDGDDDEDSASVDGWSIDDADDNVPFVSAPYITAGDSGDISGDKKGGCRDGDAVEADDDELEGEGEGEGDTAGGVDKTGCGFWTIFFTKLTRFRERCSANRLLMSCTIERATGETYVCSLSSV